MKGNTMNIIKINVDMLRAAMLVCKNENVRYILSGVSIRTNGDINATDGKVLFQGENGIIDGVLKKDIILPYFKIPVKIKQITLMLVVDPDKNENFNIRVCMYDKSMVITSINVKEIEGIYPDINSFKYDIMNCNILESKSFSVNPDFLKLAADIFPKSGGLRIEKFLKHKNSNICFIVSSMGDYLTDKQIENLENNNESLEILTEDWKFLIMPIIDKKYQND
jgi:hypothetical protein